MRDTKAQASLRPGAIAPDFCLEAASGQVHCLRDFLDERPVLLWFYRGHG